MNSIYIILAITIMLVAPWLIKLVSQRYSKLHRYLPVISAVQLFLWAAIIFSILNAYFANKSYYSYLILVLSTILILLVVWFYIRDIIAGFLFRVKHNPQLGQVLNYGTISGTIQELSHAYITIIKADGECFRIPYSTIINQVLSIQHKHASAPGQTTILLHTPISISPSYWKLSIRQTLAMSSWCIASKSIEVEPDKENPKLTKVTFYLIDPAYRPLAEQKLHHLTDQLNLKTPT